MSNLRIAGLASGMDTDAMVQSLMKVERLKVNRYEQSKQIALWRQEAYTSMNKMFANFILNTRKDMGLTRVTSTGIAFGSSYSNLDYVRKATSTNETAATVSATSNAVNGSYTITVDKLATNAKLNSTKVTDSKKFENEITINLGQGGNDIVVKNENGVTMSDVSKAINNAKQGVTAFFEVDSTKEGVLFLQTTKTGETAKINLTSSSSDFLSYFAETAVQGDNSQIDFNGQKFNYADNNITFNGLNIQLKSEGVSTTINVDTNVDGIMEKVEKLINDYNELVDKAAKVLNEKRYNNYYPLSQEEKKAMHEDDAKLWEEKAKSGMLNRDETIQRMLQNIRTDLYADVESIGEGKLNNIIQIGITTEKYSRGNTGGKLQIDKEKLRVAIEKDPEGVMELLFTEPEKLDRSMFPNTDEGNRQYEAAERANRRKNGGLFTRVYDNLIDGMKSIIDKSGPGEDADLFRNVKSNILIDFVTKKSSISDIDKEVLDANKRIDDLNALLLRKENSYYAKFGNMEKMLQQMYSQSNWLSQQFMR